MSDGAKKLLIADSIDQIIGIEGNCAQSYFSVFDKLITNKNTTLHFSYRSKRPPLDEVNALLSFVYTLFTNEFASALETVGLDSYIGYCHALRSGRSSLACDLVDIKKEYEAIAKYLLGRIVVVDTIDQALVIARKYKYTLRMVTLEGELLNAGGSMSGGAFRNQSNELCLWLIEHKLTEQEFTTCGGYRSKGISESEKENCTSCGIKELLENHDKCYYHKHCGYYYWRIMEKQYSFFCGKYEGVGCPFRGGMNQLWRNQMLALELENRGEFTEVYFSVVSHPDNCFLEKTMKEYRRLTNNSPKFYAFKSNTLVDKAVAYLPDWSSWYKKVYLGID